MKLAQKLAVGYLRARLNLLSVLSRKKAAEQAFKLFCTPLRRSKKKIPPIFESGYKLNFKLDGYTISGNKWGKPGGKKVLIVHGFESTSMNFDRYISLLQKKGYEVLAFDAPAHGRSSGKQINLPQYVRTPETITELYGL